MGEDVGCGGDAADRAGGLLASGVRSRLVGRVPSTPDPPRAGFGKREHTGQMFTGIVEELGTVRAVEVVGDGRRLVVAATTVLDDVALGASVAVNGCCLTVVEWGDDWFAVDAVPETVERTTIGDLAVGDPVNLERPLAAAGRFGGHVVQGHVDTVTEVLAVVDQSDGSRWLTFRLPDNLAGQVVEKGSVTLDGISLTVASVGESPTEGDTFDVALIPHTLKVTTLGVRSPGDRLNVEADVIARYVAGLLQAGRIPVPTAKPFEKKGGH